MKKLFLVFSLGLVCIAAGAQFNDLQTIEIGTMSTTHVIFTSDLSYVDISKQDVIAAKVVDASKNMLALKARQSFDYVTTISALEANGTMHTFKVKYNPFPSQLMVDTRVNTTVSGSTYNTQIRPDGNAVAEEKVAKVVNVGAPVAGASKSQSSAPSVKKVDRNSVVITSSETSNFGKVDAPTLEEIMKLPQQVFHIGDKCYKLEAYVSNIFVYSDLIYVVLKIFNRSDIGYEAGEAQFTIENAKKKSDNLSTEKPMWAKSSYGNLSCPPQGSTMIGYTIPKFTLLKNECLKIYIYEKKGTRNLLLTLKDKDVNYAVSPKR